MFDVNLQLTKEIYGELKYFGPLAGAAWTIFKGVEWIKDIKDNHLTHIQSGINDFNSKLDLALEAQTKDIVSASESNTNEIKELRGDIQMLTSALLTQKALRAAARKRKK